ncbi:hypothetical protein AV530_000638 [Patagioenas fasciata monilis]|uniref:Uncharacterized protein n=1 Tax=Patagioenas fasciata monilis TaxID=372326 RepID=A0A1V4IFY5_PATFA|nr:hypothetical protein AV530_000638 [Patagioenas fasciata monilis]
MWNLHMELENQVTRQGSGACGGKRRRPAALRVITCERHQPEELHWPALDEAIREAYPYSRCVDAFCSAARSQHPTDAPSAEMVVQQ